MGLCFKMYAPENSDFFPPIQAWVGDDCNVKNTGILMFDGFAMYPEYLTDSAILVCPSDMDGKQQFDLGRWNRPDGRGGSRATGSTNPCLLDQLSYFYTGWVFETEWVAEEATNDMSWFFADALATVIGLGSVGDLQNDWTFIDEMGVDHTVFRLREGIERFFIEDINNPSKTAVSQSRVPVMFDKIDLNVEEFNHVPGGGNVLYMDGHMEYVRYPGEFPVSRAWAELVDALDF